MNKAFAKCMLLSVVAWGAAACVVGERSETARDASTPIDSTADGGRDADTNAPTAECNTNFDCPLGRVCEEHRCSEAPVGTQCCGRECPEGAVCDDQCRCIVRPDNCCTSPEICTDGYICEGDCGCRKPCIPTCPAGQWCTWDGRCRGACNPECPSGKYCDGGICHPLCELEGCPDGQVCAPEGCGPPRCTDGECAMMSPIRSCVPELGCLDTCSEYDRAQCVARGLECLRGECIRRDGCECRYQTDCCGQTFCLKPGDPAPECPSDCSGVLPPSPNAALCACDVVLDCSDGWNPW